MLFALALAAQTVPADGRAQSLLRHGRPVDFRSHPPKQMAARRVHGGTKERVLRPLSHWERTVPTKSWTEVREISAQLRFSTNFSLHRRRFRQTAFANGFMSPFEPV